jgi:hypothetical protein
MTPTLPAPEVVRCYFDTTFEPHLPAMCLRWRMDDAEAEMVWQLPEGVRFSGLPLYFGIRIQRHSANSYAVRLLWDRTRLTWLDLTRDQLLDSDLDPLLAALGTDLWYLLDQSLPHTEFTPPQAA